MSRLLIRGGRVLDPASGIDENIDVLVKDGKVFGLTHAAPSDWSDATEVDAAGKWVIPGLICLRTQAAEPGYEWREDVHTASLAGAAGGFTTICVSPMTDPVNDVRAVTEQIMRRAESAPGARVLPVGAASLGLNGAHLSEMGDLKDAGCVAVSTGSAPVDSAAFMRRILEYSRTIGLPVFTVPEESSLATGAILGEGDMALRLGMASVPAEAECIAIYRDALMARVAEWPVHFQNVSTAAGVALLRQLRAEGVPVSASVTPHHLWFTDDAVAGFDTRTRIRPPLRFQADVDALRAAVNDGTISVIATDHSPHTSIEKAIEYEWAEPGTTGLESALSVVLELARDGHLDLTQALHCLTAGPADTLGRNDLGRLAEGATADITIVDPDTPHRVESATMESRSRYCIFEGMSLSGVVTETIVGGRNTSRPVEEFRIDR